MNEKKNWYAVYVRPGRERKVAEILNRRRIENYCPFHKVVHSLNHRKRPDELLFNSCAFVRIFENEIPDLIAFDGLINFLFWLDKPAVIHNSEIETIRVFLKTYTMVRFEKVGINVNPEKLAAGYLLKEDEEFILDGNKIARVMLPSLGYLMVAEKESVNTDMIFRNIPTEVKSQAG